MPVHRLETVDAFIVFDLDDCDVNAGGTRFAADVTEEETALLARAMTYKFAVLERKLGGAKAGVRGEPAEKDALMRAYCEEVRPLVESGRFLTGPDLGTSETDFVPLRGDRGRQHIMASAVGDVPFEDVLTGFGVVAAAEAAMGSLDGCTLAIEGFGKAGGGVAREAVRRGARVVAVSTADGNVQDPAGLDVELMVTLRRTFGDTFIWHLGREVDESPAGLFDVEADVLVPGARPGVMTGSLAERLRTKWVVPAANVPYTAEGLEVLRGRRIRALPDFVCNAGAVIGYTQPGDIRPGEVFREVERRITGLVEVVGADPRGHFAGGCELAEGFLRSWRGDDGLPPGPPVA